MLLREYKRADGAQQTETIDDPDRIHRYLGYFSDDQVAKLEAGEKLWIEDSYWQIV